MKFGICCGINEANAAIQAGFDYIEVGATGFDGLNEEWDPEPYVGHPVEVTNLFFPGSIRLVGPEASDYLFYAKHTIERAAFLEVKVMVVGSGGSRRAPDNVDGESEFAKVCRDLGTIAKPFGIIIAPESLNRDETNVGNDLATLALRMKDEGVSYTADSYHVLKEWDKDGRQTDLATLWRQQIPYAPAHVHLARLHDRAAPEPDDLLLQGFVRRLKEFGYEGRVSLEGSRPAGYSLGRICDNMRSLFDRN